MIQIRLLTVSQEEIEGFEPFFEEVTNAKVTEISPQVVNEEAKIKIGDEYSEQYDALFTKIPVKNAVFGRVMLETAEEKGISVDNFSTAYFTAAKKNYLYYVLKKRGIKAPETAVVATEKAARDISNEIEPPIIGRKLEDMKETEKRKIEESEGIQSFSEGTDYEDNVLLFQKYNDAEKYRCLVIGDEIISLSENSESWKFEGTKLKYSNISDKKKEIVSKTCRSLGANIVEVLLRGEEVYDIDPNPDLELYSEKAGKDVFSSVAKALKGDTV